MKISAALRSRALFCGATAAWLCAVFAGTAALGGGEGWVGGPATAKAVPAVRRRVVITDESPGWG